MHSTSPDRTIELNSEADSTETVQVLDGKAPNTDGSREWFRICETTPSDPNGYDLIKAAGKIAEQTETFNGKTLNIHQSSKKEEIKPITMADLPTEELETIADIVNHNS